MEEDRIHNIEELLPSYFSGDIDADKRELVDRWKEESDENKKLFDDSLVVWERGAILGQIDQFDKKKAWRRVEKRLSLYNSVLVLKTGFQRVAAILLLPVLVYAGFVSFEHFSEKEELGPEVTLQKVNSPSGAITELALPDGTHVWLNRESSLEYPIPFSNNRMVSLKGEAYFEVKKDQAHPFIVNTGKLNVEVLGTVFNVSCYQDATQTDVTLVSGRLKLFTAGSKKDFFLSPNQHANFDLKTNELVISDENTFKYTSWKDGILLLDSDPMDVVAEKLARWFNVEISIENNELKDYVYKGRFSNESLKQILDLLSISAPIKYRIIERKILPNGEYSKQKVIIQKAS